MNDEVAQMERSHVSPYVAKSGTKGNDAFEMTEMNYGLKVNGHYTTPQPEDLPGVSSSGKNTPVADGRLQEEVTMLLVLRDGDVRFGISIIGGSDQGHPAEIDLVTPDSPAFLAGVRKGDVILSVDEHYAYDLSHSDVISFMTEGNKRRKMTLTVLREVRPGNMGFVKEDLAAGIRSSFRNIFRKSGSRRFKQGLLRRSSGRKSGRTRVAPIQQNVKGISNKGFLKEDRPIDSSSEGKLLSLSELFSTFENMNSKLQTRHDKEIHMLALRFFGQLEFQSTVKMYNCMMAQYLVQRAGNRHHPSSTTSLELVREVGSLTVKKTPATKELIRLFNMTTFQGLLAAHDRIARRAEMMSPNQLKEAPQYNAAEDTLEEAVKIVRIDKGLEPLGATVCNRGEDVIINRIIKGGAAERSGLLHIGDEILEINSTSVKGMPIDSVSDLMMSLQGTITFLIEPAHVRETREEKVYMRALFDYFPSDDQFQPCKELGMVFRKGDILEVVVDQDEDYWQARVHGNDTRLLAGLIPSKLFQQQRDANRHVLPNDVDGGLSKRGCCLCFQGKKKVKKLVLEQQMTDMNTVESLTYETVYLSQPDPHWKRLFVLVGHEFSGVNTLLWKLLRGLPQLCSYPVYHSTHGPRKDDVKETTEYVFSNKKDFQGLIDKGKFFDYFKENGALFGISYESIQEAIRRGKMCTLSCSGQNLNKLRNAVYRPYIVFVTVPSEESIRNNPAQKQTSESFYTRLLSDSEITSLVEHSQYLMEALGHTFDHVLVNTDLDTAYDELVRVAESVALDPQWMPVAWRPS